MDESVVAALADRHALLVLDNCEHVRDGVAPFAGAAARRLPAADRAGHQPGPADGAVRARLSRSRRCRWPATATRMRSRCSSTGPRRWAGRWRRSSAARSPRSAGGWTGWRWRSSWQPPGCPRSAWTASPQVLSDQLRLLTGGRRADDRHRSVRAMLDWSHALLEPDDRTLLRRIAVFVAPFTVDAAGEVAGFAPLETGAVVDGLARLTEQSLLTAAPSPAAPATARWRPSASTGRSSWPAPASSTTSAPATCAGAWRSPPSWPGPRRRAPACWRAGFDAVADDIRAALGWAADRPEHRADAYDLAIALAQLTFTRNLVGESQQRYEQAAIAGRRPGRRAIGAPARRGGGRLPPARRRHVPAVPRRRGRRAPRRGHRRAARDLATAAAIAYRFSGTVLPGAPAGRGGGAACRGPRAGRRRPRGPGRGGAGRVRGPHRRVRAPSRREPETTRRGDDRARRAGGRPGHAAPAIHCRVSAALDALTAVRSAGRATPSPPHRRPAGASSCSRRCR